MSYIKPLASKRSWHVRPDFQNLTALHQCDREWLLMNLADLIDTALGSNV